MADPTQINPFLLLAVPQRYPIDRSQIEWAYRQRLSAAHPDAAGSKPVNADQHDPAALNKARSVLLSDEQRAIALLAILGGPDASACRDLPDGFLMDMMMQRQEIESAIETGGEQERAEWERWGVEQRRAHRDRVADLFEGLSERAQPEELREIRVELNAWRYIERLIEQLDPEYDPANADL